MDTQTELERIRLQGELASIQGKACKAVIQSYWQDYYHEVAKQPPSEQDDLFIQELKTAFSMKKSIAPKMILTVNLSKQPSDDTLIKWHARVLEVLEKFSDKEYVPSKYLLAFEQRSEDKDKLEGFHFHIVSSHFCSKSKVLKEWHRRLHALQPDKNQYDFRVFQGTEEYLKGGKKEKKQSRSLIDNYYRNKFELESFYQK